jgi:hypothetical protein
VAVTYSFSNPTDACFFMCSSYSLLVRVIGFKRFGTRLAKTTRFALIHLPGDLLFYDSTYCAYFYCRQRASLD